MTQGILITPNFTLRAVVVNLSDLQESEATPVYLDESTPFVAYRVEGSGEPNPAASMAYNQNATSNPAFFADPTRALLGDVVCVRADAADTTQANLDAASELLRAAQAYCQDYPEEYALWKAAARRL